MTHADYIPLSLFIGGRWIAGSERDAVPVLNPATEEVLAELPLATPTDVDAALDAAEQGFRQWRSVAAWERGRVLARAGHLLRDRAERIATIITLEEGKTIGEARGEVLASAEIFEWCAEEGKRAYGRLVPARVAGQRQLVIKEPAGPVAAFAPWNFPAITPARKIAAALAAGCSCILKPAEETPGSALAIAKALEHAGLPAGVLNIVFGVPEDVSRRLLASPIIRKMSFTGSTPVGRRLAKLAAEGLKRTTLELGGHAPVLVFDDANIDRAVNEALLWKRRNAGQVCTSPTRFYVQDAVFSPFVERLAAAAAALKIGNGLAADMQMGPLANERRRDAVEALVTDALARGARLHAGGERLVRDRGLYFPLTVISETPDDARAMHEEPFGPLALVNRFSTFEEAIQKANGTPYGLAAYAWTQSASTAIALGDHLEAGMIGVNTFSVATPEAPFGGHKDSGYGAEGGTEGLDGYLQTKLVSQMSV